MQQTLALVLISSALLSWFYTAVLERIHDVYAPNWIWVTVLVGNSGIVGTTAGMAALGFIPWAAVFYFIAANVAWGVPVILWQLRAADKRRRQREE